MTSRLLTQTGEALYGPRWQTELSRDLGMSDRHMRRLVAGDADLTTGMIVDLMRIVQNRVQALDDVFRRLQTATAHSPDTSPDRKT